MTVVMKFGGSSLADAACMRQVAALVQEAAPRAPLVVLSAMGKTTDSLFKAARLAHKGEIERALAEARAVVDLHRATAGELLDGDVPEDVGAALDQHASELELVLRSVCLLRELTPRSMDAVASHGERLSTLLFAAHLGRGPARVELADARAFLRTDAAHGAAQPQMEATRKLLAERVAPILAPGRAVVTQGYIGATEEGHTSTLGRGGSDFSAAIFGALLAAEEVEIWTDVEGVLTADPRLIDGALPIPELTFEEAAELAAFGAKVLHPATIQPAVDADVPVTVRHTLRPRGAFTVIGRASGQVVHGLRVGGAPWRGERLATALASRAPVTVLTMSSTRMFNQVGYLAKVFEIFARLGVSVDVVSTAEVALSVTIEGDAPLAALRSALEPFAGVVIAEERAIVAVVGERLRQTPGIAARALEALGPLPVEMLSMGANEINLSLVVRREHLREAMERLHSALILAPRRAAAGAES